MNDTLTAYLTCALWSSTSDNGEPLDESYGIEDLALESIEAATAEIQDFLALCEKEGADLSGLSDEQVGQDLWLTRNRHGTGFWDRGLGELGDQLTDLACTYGSQDCYECNDGMIRLS